MEDIPVSFSWVYPKIHPNGNCIAYCFAYIRDSKNYSVLYAGVKYNGLYSELKSLKNKLRRTALERLYKKPIYSNFCIGDEANYHKNLSDPTFKFNGIINDKVSKKSVSLGKFFMHCALNKKYSNLGISANKSAADMKFCFNKETDKYEILLNKKNDNTVFVTYGYDYKGDEMRRIVGGNQVIETIFNLRRRARFYGKNKERRSFELLKDIDENYLSQFGVVPKKNEEKKIRLKEYILDKRVIFYRIYLSNNTQAHIALMEFHDWVKYVEEVYKKPVDVHIPGLLFNTYCMGFTIGRIRSNLNEKKIYRKIAVDRMIDRPNIVDADFFDNMKVKDIRTWFGDRIGYFSEEGMGRIDYKNPINLTSYYINLTRYNEDLIVYGLKEENRGFFELLKDWFKRLIYV